LAPSSLPGYTHSLVHRSLHHPMTEQLTQGDLTPE
jgi:hypothetical protein